MKGKGGYHSGRVDWEITVGRDGIDCIEGALESLRSQYRTLLGLICMAHSSVSALPCLPTPSSLHLLSSSDSLPSFFPPWFLPSFILLCLSPCPPNPHTHTTTGAPDTSPVSAPPTLTPTLLINHPGTHSRTGSCAHPTAHQTRSNPTSDSASPSITPSNPTPSRPRSPFQARSHPNWTPHN